MKRDTGGMNPVAISEEVVQCDENCGALTNPQSLEEYRAALEHWKNHSECGGCSHGC